MPDAQRILNVISTMINSKIKSGAGVDITYGQVFGITAGQECSVYLAGSRELAASGGEVAVPAEGFRIPGHMIVAASDYVQVFIDDRGHRWINHVMTSTDYAKMAMDAQRGTILLGNGSVSPSIGLSGQVPMVDPTGAGMVYATPSDLISIPFVYSNPAGTASNVEMPPFDAANPAATPRVTIPWQFEIVGITVRVSSARTAGTLTVTPRISGVAVNYSAVIDASNTVSATGTGLETHPANKGVAGNDIGLVFSTSAFTPISNYIYGTVFALMHRQVAIPVGGTGSFAADAVLRGSGSSLSFSANAVLFKTTSATFTADAFFAAASAGGTVYLEDHATTDVSSGWGTPS